MHNSLLSIYNLLEKESEIDIIRKLLVDFLLKYDVIGKTHPLGFTVFTLGSINQNINLRLHIWHNDATLQDENLLIHNHTFDFKSLVLFGKITNIFYDIEKTNILEENGAFYKVSYSSNGSELNKSKEGLLKKVISSETIETNSFYSVKNDQFHESNLASEFAITLLATKNVSQEKPLVYTDKELGSKLTFKRTNLPIDTQSELISDAIHKLKTFPNNMYSP